LKIRKPQTTVCGFFAKGKAKDRIPLCGTSPSQFTASTKAKRKEPEWTLFFLVEVARLELAASSTRTNTPSFFDYFC